MYQPVNNTPSGSGLGDNLYLAFGKVNANTVELYTLVNSITGSLAKTLTSEFTNDGEDGVNPFISVGDTISSGSVQGLDAALVSINLELQQLTSSSISNASSSMALQSDMNAINSTITTILSDMTAQNILISGIQGDIADIYNIINNL